MDNALNKHLPLCIYIVLGLTTLAIFWQVQYHDFVNYDDPKYVSENQRVRAGLNYDNAIWAFTTGHTGSWHPLTWLSHMLDCQLFGDNPGWHHLINLLLHVASTLLLFSVLRVMTGALWQSTFVAAAFAFHPLNVQSVSVGLPLDELYSPAPRSCGEAPFAIPPLTVKPSKTAVSPVWLPVTTW